MRVDLNGTIDETPVTIGVTTGTAVSFLQGQDKVPFALRAEAAGARSLMLEQPSVIRRPVVEWPDGTVTVGFDPVNWSLRTHP